jgi:uncharacterized protein (DUF2062 family)
MGSVDEESVMPSFLRRRVAQPIKALLLQGITPEKIALSLACGAVLAVFPVLGSTTLLCAAAAIILRLNLPATQLVNYLMYPVQLALIVPFLRAGAFLFRTKPLPFSLSQMLTMFRGDARHTLALLWVSALQAVVVWTLCAPFAIAALYAILRPVIARVSRTLRPAEGR